MTFMVSVDKAVSRLPAKQVKRFSTRPNAPAIRCLIRAGRASAPLARASFAAAQSVWVRNNSPALRAAFCSARPSRSRTLSFMQNGLSDTIPTRARE